VEYFFPAAVLMDIKECGHEDTKTRRKKNILNKRRKQNDTKNDFNDVGFAVGFQQHHYGGSKPGTRETRYETDL
jgi:hypothetical protein